MNLGTCSVDYGQWADYHLTTDQCRIVLALSRLKYFPFIVSLLALNLAYFLSIYLVYLLQIYFKKRLNNNGKL